MTQPSAPTLQQLLKQLDTNGDGLSGTEAAKRLQQSGLNALPEKKRSKLAMLLSCLWGPMRWMIEAAILLCAIVGDWVDFAINLGLLVGNTLIAYFEESSAGDAVAALKAKLALESLVKRRSGAPCHRRCGSRRYGGAHRRSAAGGSGRSHR